MVVLSKLMFWYPIENFVANKCSTKLYFYPFSGEAFLVFEGEIHWGVARAPSCVSEHLGWLQKTWNIFRNVRKTVKRGENCILLAQRIISAVIFLKKVLDFGFLPASIRTLTLKRKNSVQLSKLQFRCPGEKLWLKRWFTYGLWMELGSKKTDFLRFWAGTIWAKSFWYYGELAFDVSRERVCLKRFHRFIKSSFFGDWVKHYGVFIFTASHQ